MDFMHQMSQLCFSNTEQYVCVHACTILMFLKSVHPSVF